MNKVFVRIPCGMQLQYPSRCPFTGKAAPTGAVRITRIRLPLPMLGATEGRRSVTLRFPAAWTRSWALHVLSLGIYAGIAAFLAGWYCTLFQSGATADLVGAQMIWWGLAGWAVCWCAATALRWPVRVVHIGSNSTEIQFLNQDFAREFCALNGLDSSSHRTRKRSLWGMFGG